MIKNNINQFKINGEVKLAPATNHLIQSISHKETGDLIIYSNRIFLSEKSFSNNVIDFIKTHFYKDGLPIRKMIILSPSKLGCDHLRKIINDNGFNNVSIYLTQIITTNFVVEKNNVLFGVENFLEHSETNSPSVTIKDAECRNFFVNYAKELFIKAQPIVDNNFDKDFFK